MKVLFFKIWNDEWCHVCFTRMSQIKSIKTVFFDIDRKHRAKIAESDDTMLTELEHFDGSLKEMYRRHEELTLKHDPDVDKKKIYNKRTYKKYSIEKHQCDCGSTMVNRKQVITKHLTTKKHKEYMEN